MSPASLFTASHRGGSGPPLVCVHGFTDTWRTWELVLPALQRHHDVLAPTLPGHAGGPRLEAGEVSDVLFLDAIERAMDEAGFDTAHFVGNSLGGRLVLQLAARGRAESVVALAPGSGWAEGDESYRETIAYFERMRELLGPAAPQADAFMATPEGRRRATSHITTNYEHIPAELLAHLMVGAARCDAVPMIKRWRRERWRLDAERIACPVRIVWGTEDRLLRWPAAAARYRDDWLPHADWVELEGIGHCPQLDVPLETAQLILGFTAPRRGTPPA